MQLKVSEMQLSRALGPPSGAHAPLHRARSKTKHSRHSRSGYDVRSPFKIPTAPIARQPESPARLSTPHGLRHY